MELPAGCAFWQSVGGPLAWTAEMHLLALIEYRAHALGYTGKGRKPELIKPPPFTGQVRADEARMASKAERWKARQGG